MRFVGLVVFNSPPSRRGRRADQTNGTLSSVIGAAGEVRHLLEAHVLLNRARMRERDLNLINIPPLKDRRKELRNKPTEPEALLWKHLRRRQLLDKKFRRQYSIGRYIVDFFCVECDIAIELDGAPHFAELKEDYEAERTAFLEAQGIQIIRFENRVLYDNFEAVLETIRDAIRNKCLTSPAAPIT
jgi:very-short-patch-repair endonuclease